MDSPGLSNSSTAEKRRIATTPLLLNRQHCQPRLPLPPPFLALTCSSQGGTLQLSLLAVLGLPGTNPGACLRHVGGHAVGGCGVGTALGKAGWYGNAKGRAVRQR